MTPDAAVIHVVGQERGIDVGDLGGRDFCVLEIAVAFGVGRAESIGYPLGELAQIPTVSQFGILPVLVEGNDSAQPIGAETFGDVGKIAGQRCSRIRAIFAHGDLAGGEDQQKYKAHDTPAGGWARRPRLSQRMTTELISKSSTSERAPFSN